MGSNPIPRTRESAEDALGALFPRKISLGRHPTSGDVDSAISPERTRSRHDSRPVDEAADSDTAPGCERRTPALGTASRTRCLTRTGGPWVRAVIGATVPVTLRKAGGRVSHARRPTSGADSGYRASHDGQGNATRGVADKREHEGKRNERQSGKRPGGPDEGKRRPTPPRVQRARRPVDERSGSWHCVDVFTRSVCVFGV